MWPYVNSGPEAAGYSPWSWEAPGPGGLNAWLRERWGWGQTDPWVCWGKCYGEESTPDAERAVVMWPPADWTCGVCGHLWQAMLYTGYKPSLLVLTTYFILEN